MSCYVCCAAGEEYNGGRTPADFVSFINSRAGTQRQVGGGFDDSAGRLSHYSALVKRFVKADASEKAAIVTEALGLSDSSSATSKPYLTAFQQIVNGKVDYAKTEIARLQKMLQGGHVKAKDKANFSKRINILKEFDEQ